MRTRLTAVLFLLSVPLAAASLKLVEIPARDAGILADPDSRAYYLYASAETSVVAYKSKDLGTWEGPFSVFQVPEDSWANPAQGARNPKVYAYRGKYYLFVTLGNNDSIIAKPPESWRVNSRQGTQVFVADSPAGPFRAIPNSENRSHTPPDFVALGGALFVEGDFAWLIYAHDWTQLIDANMEAIRLKADLSAAVEEAIYLFKASDAPWLARQTAAAREPRHYAAGGPNVYRTRNGSLVMVWSSLEGNRPAVTVARSVTGKIRGPWNQAGVLIADGSEPGTLFRTFDGRLMMVVNRPLQDGKHRARLVELEDLGDTLRVKPAPASKGGKIQ